MIVLLALNPEYHKKYVENHCLEGPWLFSNYAARIFVISKDIKKRKDPIILKFPVTLITDLFSDFGYDLFELPN